MIYGTCYRHIERSISIKNAINCHPIRHCKPPAAAYSPGGVTPIFKAPDLLRTRFVEEARASLPGLLASETDITPEDVFAAMELQRIRLRQDQQVPEWVTMDRQAGAG